MWHEPPGRSQGEYRSVTDSTAADADIVVIGAGLVGAACALRLADAGREVLLVDAQAPGMGASFGNAGHVATEQLFPLASPEVLRASWRYLLDADSPLRLRLAYLLPILPWLARFVWAARPAAFARGTAALMALQHTARADLQDLLGHAGIGHLLHLDGYVRMWETPAGETKALAQAEVLRPYGIRSGALSVQAVRVHAPGLTAEVRGGVLYPDTGHVDDPHAVCAGIVAALQRAGGVLRKTRVTGMAQTRDGSISLALAQGQPLRCRQAVVCAGAWSRPLAASLGYRVPLDTERGYHLTLPWPGSADRVGAPERMALPLASTERNVIMTPMSVGLRMTGTVELGGLSLPPDPHRFALLRTQMEALLPGVRTAEASTWMGFRPSLPDHLPVLCEAPRHPGVFFAFGHQHLGLTLSGVTARLVAGMVQGQPSGIDMAPYHVGRF